MLEPAPSEAMQLCPAPQLFSEFVSENAFNALPGAGQVNKALEYAAYTIAVGGECAARHKALVEHREGLG